MLEILSLISDEITEVFKDYVVGCHHMLTGTLTDIYLIRLFQKSMFFFISFQSFCLSISFKKL